MALEVLKKNDFENLIKNYKPDIVCVQELKMNSEIPNNYGYYAYYNFALSKGYSGSMILTKEKPLNVSYNLGLPQFDDEGRFIMLEYSNFYVISIYMPHGG